MADAIQQVRMLRWMLMDALRHAEAIATRCTEASEGTDEMFLFDAARKAIGDFCEKDEAMKALSRAAVSDRL